MSTDEEFMREALREARKGAGQTSPNPAVGAVLVSGNQIVSRGYHRGAGLPHAEIECLQRFKRSVPKDAVLYVTLEPCSSVGKTGACTDALVRANVKSVVIGAIDFNPLHRGRGVERLRDAGLRVQVGVLAEECTALNEHFNKWVTTGLPFVIAKCGMSLDGRLTRRPNESQWLTSAAARRHARSLRNEVDAILVGAETVRADNPRLTARPQRGKQPFRVVVTRTGILPKSAKIFSDRFSNRTLVYRRKSLPEVLRALGEKEVTSVLIEGGGDLLGQALDRRLIDKIQVYLGPILTGGPVVSFAGFGAAAKANAMRLKRVKYEKIGQEICISGYSSYDETGKAE
jgi:diaminohydroxyphosphoribosylaminopyrimidine deaminase/5-amino-6-(5-phosphoribosylamino)uracil reductase